MNSFAVREQDYAQVSAVHFGDGGPSPDATILLSDLPDRMLHDMQHLLLANHSTIRAKSHLVIIQRELHNNSVTMG